jgi:hypothetical protein
MAMRHVALCGGIVGLIISCVILTLLAFGVSGVLTVHSIQLMNVFWPSSTMLTVGWRTTPVGITITVLSVVINSLTYSAIVLLLRAGIRSALGLVRHGSAK